MSFGAPQYLYALLLSGLPLLACLVVSWYVRRGWTGFDLGRLRAVSRLAASRRPVWLALLFLLGSDSLIVAAARPRLATERRQPVYQTVDLVFLLDTSLSMRARDVRPSRLERARDEIKDFIINRSGDRVGRLGLVTFAGSSMILSYLTRDASNILFYLDSLEPDGPSTYGTDIGGAIGNAIVLIEKERAAGTSSSPADLAFVLVSDGEDNGPGMTRAVRQAAEAGYRIYTIGIGSQAGGMVPVRGADGQWTWLLDENGEAIVATFDEGTLRSASAATGGDYYRSYTGGELRDALDEILGHARRMVGLETVTGARALEGWFLAAGVVLLGIFLFA
ncbi:MAG: VWA domain-containing protein [Acidobacteria bacterium]|nr:VWA domain-containing protein [Acidobacteriota bacterium]